MGIARVKQLTEATVTCDRRGAGTYPYMAPEMFTKSHRGPAADIYSLGCLYIELFGRKRVWPNLEGPEIMMRVLGSFNNPPRVPSTTHLTPMFGDICSKMCTLEAMSRPNSKEVLVAVKQISDIILANNTATEN